MTALRQPLRHSQLEMLSDEEVVRRVLAGEDPLFEIIMRRHNQRLYRTVRSILSDEDEVEDVMQQAYVNAYSHLAQFAGEAKFSTWLTRIALNEALARKRRGSFVITESGCGEPCEDLMSELRTTAPDPQEQTLHGELQRALEAEIHALPETYQTVFVLREVEGLSTEETARCLDVSEDVVKTRLHRARGMLRDGLFARAGLTLESLFPFHAPRCDRLVVRVLDALADRRG